MEEGSLVQEALLASRQSRENGGSLRNHLIVDLFCLNGDAASEQGARIAAFQELVALCKLVNDSFATLMKSYPWFAGGDGPVFGISQDGEVPHLRASCRYGPTITDEWAMIFAVMQISREQMMKDAVVKFWDADDGHVLLIESAMVLPQWVDEVGPIGCEHRCWVVRGEVVLIRPQVLSESFSLNEALQSLRDGEQLEQLPDVQEAIEKRIVPFKHAHTSSSAPFRWRDFTHGAAVLLPRQIALLIDKYPSILHCAVASFEKCGYGEPPLGTIDFVDLVWTTQRFGRTSFALLRNLQTPAWTAEDHIPTVYKSIEVNRMKRTCAVESTPHLQHALELGIRITAGLDYALVASSTNQNKDVSAEERILNYWTKFDIACGGDGVWLRQAWIAGPNQSPIDLSEFISCLLSSVDVMGFPFCRTHPRKSLKQIVQPIGGIKQLASEKKPTFVIPGPDEVDDEKWMYLTGGERELASFLPSGTGREQSPLEESQQEDAKPLDELLGDFAAFVEKPSDVKGVTTMEAEDKSAVNYDADQDYLAKPVDIDPKLFLNLLQKVLTSTPEEISNLTTATIDDDDLLSNANDPFFSCADYNLEGEGDDGEIRAMMEAMDLELQSKQQSNDDDDDDDVPVKMNREVAQDAQVLSGLLESLDASEGAAGPVRNILREMKASKSPPSNHQ